MILQRISKALRQKDWFTVVIETLIVVFGVFIGLQVNNWNEARVERTDSKMVLQRLEQDFELIIDRTDRSLAIHIDYFQSAERLIRGIRSQKFEEETLFQDMTNAAGLTAPPGASATFRQLVSSGHLELIRNQDLRRALTEYDAYINFMHGIYPVYERPLTEARHTLMQASTLRITDSPTTDWAQLEKRDDVDRTMLMTNLEMMTSLQIAYAVQDNLYAFLYRIRGQILELLERIRAEQEKEQ
jgi:hypothetical protein